MNDLLTALPVLNQLLPALQDLHLLRPLWLLALLPVPVLVWLLHQRRAKAGQWQHIIDADLLPAMLSDQHSGQQGSMAWWWLAGWCIAVIALAGPAVQKLPQPVHKNQQALVILLDMSASMAAQDIKPSRSVRAIQKVTDIVRARRDGLTALVVYAGDAHTVTPLTDDGRTIESLLPSLSPFIMPAPGSRPDKAIALGQQLTQAAGIPAGDLLLITDGVQQRDIARIQTALQPGFRLSLLTLGTAEGAPVALPDGGFLRDGSGRIVLPGFDPEPVQALAQTLGIGWQPLALDDRDWQRLLNQDASAASGQRGEQTFDVWRDEGFWLLLILLPLTLLLFRRGVLLSVAVLAIALYPSDPAYAAGWQDWWKTRDQQGAELFELDPAAAAERFRDPAWRGSAAYRAGDYAAAADAFAAHDDAIAHYNRGNALANSGELDAALDAYDQALQRQPDFPAAERNRAIVEQALQQQQQSQSSSQSDEQSGEQQSGQQSDRQNGGESGTSEQNPDESSSAGQQSSDNQGDSSATDPESTGQNPQQAQADDAFAREQADKLSQAGQQSADRNDEESAAAAEQPEAKNTEQDESAASATPSTDTGTDTGTDTDTDTEAGTDSGKPAGQLSREEQAAMEKWLQRVPDNPGNLLQRKFLYQYRQQTPAGTQEDEVLW